jgi:uncharacterized membrane protein
MNLPAALLIHIATATFALLAGAINLTVAKSSPIHRRLGYAWVLAMAGAAISSFALRSNLPIQFMGFSPIHLLSVYTLYALANSVSHAKGGRIMAHRAGMRRAYISLCVAAAFTMLPGRLIGHWLWSSMA